MTGALEMWNVVDRTANYVACFCADDRVETKDNFWSGEEGSEKKCKLVRESQTPIGLLLSQPFSTIEEHSL